MPARAGRAGRPAAPGACGGAPGRAEVRLGCRAAEPGARGLGLGARSTRRAGPCLTYDLGQVARSLELEGPGFKSWDCQLPHSDLGRVVSPFRASVPSSEKWGLASQGGVSIG